MEQHSKQNPQIRQTDENENSLTIEILMKSINKKKDYTKKPMKY